MDGSAFSNIPVRGILLTIGGGAILIGALIGAALVWIF